ncbi:histidine phosphatase family protein [Mycobacteroides salmoniphilum]|uniref:Putative phosphoserine phosphatase 2 n=1 Tax=Mycobacteroides salmoniphilum TaxID=404941 RepID=A0A4R8T0I9_9MYCO|nr:histidine phosphatase family protein [Mycobacteroides salmoniphilum]TEA09018.1 putative phosphoserine phosphatase 2 [Mycobacteroides salmoniphilum]
MRQSKTRAMSRALTTVIAALVFSMVTAIVAWAADPMTITFVRHGESEGNASGKIDTSVPGPHLTPTGQQQAKDIADKLGSGFDGIYASDMIRTQETAKPMEDKLGEKATVLGGLREIGAGIFEGQSEKDGIGRIGYIAAPLLWTLGARFVPVPGGEDGNAFDARVDDSVKTIYENGDRNAVVYSHGATIMFWVMMNVDNPDPTLLLSDPLSNTSVVKVEGTPEGGWILKEWNGKPVNQNPSLPTKLFVDFRNFFVQPQTTAYRIQQAIATGDISKVADEVAQGVVDVIKSTVHFPVAVARDVINEVRGALPKAVDQSATPDAAVAENKSTAVHESKVNAGLHESKLADVKVIEAKKTATVVEATEQPAGPTKLATKANESAAPELKSPEVKAPEANTPETQEPAVKAPEVATPAKVITLPSKPVKANGATDLTGGNKSEPGKTPNGVQRVKDHLAATLQKASDAVQKITGTPPKSEPAASTGNKSEPAGAESKAAKPATSSTSKSGGSDGSGATGSSHKDAA